MLRNQIGGNVNNNEKQRVQAGAAVLDEHNPGWHNRIDLDTLQLACGCDCVLGQIYQEMFPTDILGSTYLHVLDSNETPVNRGNAWNLGFDINKWVNERWVSQGEYLPLETEWVKLIRERRNQPTGKKEPELALTT
jgi:hypothetical protein